MIFSSIPAYLSSLSLNSLVFGTFLQTTAKSSFLSILAVILATVPCLFSRIVIEFLTCRILCLVLKIQFSRRIQI